MVNFKETLLPALAKHPRNETNSVQYGTAGFRMKAERLGYITFRIGVLAAMRSQMKSAVCGVMITASHNPACDNGVKLVDSLGEMLHMDWESYATKLVNCSDEELVGVVQSIIDENNIVSDRPSTVYLGMDTRPSSQSLSLACKDGVEAMGGVVKDYGLVTTPQLHYMVWSFNTASTHPPTEEGYYLKMVNAYKQLVELCTPAKTLSKKVTVDGANGVGALKVKQLQTHLGDLLELVSVFDGSNDGVLNYQCGTDYVKSHQISPEGLQMSADDRYASLDGDADRLIYYYKTHDDVFHVLDGDKIAILMSSYLKDLLNTSGLSTSVVLGLVQTAYANGASTDYITQTLTVPVACTKTGVKHLHAAAHQFDIGVYFEANGHGTILFSENATQCITKAAANADRGTPAGVASLKLAAVMTLINQVVGDALSDLLLVEAILYDKAMSPGVWDQQYTDLPNALTKVCVADRQIIKTTDAERKTTSPEGLQQAIDDLVAKFNRARSFVRPSGTEDIVRVYAEADTTESVRQLIHQVSTLVYDMCNGVGEKPKLN